MKGIHVITDVNIRTTTKDHYAPISWARTEKSGTIKYNSDVLLMGV